MEPTPEGEGRKRPAWRMWVILLGALVLILLVIDRLERLVAPEPQATTEIAQAPAEPPEPVRPRIIRTEDGVRVEVGLYRTTVRLGADDGSADDLVACIEERIERAMADGKLTVTPASRGLIAGIWSDAKVAEEVNRILWPCYNAILDVPDLPELPPLPPLPE